MPKESPGEHQFSTFYNCSILTPIKKFHGRPLVSIIITSYNHAAYLSTAIESALVQTYDNIEVLVIDDGSTDETSAIASRYKQINYIYQHNKGLSAARNAGVAASKGEFLVFLDADDWLLSDGVAKNLEYILPSEEVAFVAGGFNFHYSNTQITQPSEAEVKSDHYENLLLSNYIIMHGAVMYRRWVFDYFLFDLTLEAAEDYDMYLNVSRSFIILHHCQLISTYRKHGSNLSSNILLMLENVIEVLMRQQKYLTSDREKHILETGLLNWQKAYSNKLCYSVFSRPFRLNTNKIREFKFLLKQDNRLIAKAFKILVRKSAKRVLKGFQ